MSSLKEVGLGLGWGWDGDGVRGRNGKEVNDTLRLVGVPSCFSSVTHSFGHRCPCSTSDHLHV